MQNVELNGIKTSNDVINAYTNFLKIIWSLYDICFQKVEVKLKPKAQFRTCIMKGIENHLRKSTVRKISRKKQSVKNKAEHRGYKKLFEVKKNFDLRKTTTHKN